ncbi:Zinc finger PHD-finger [Penicillium cosmopolitanum]|uniref:Chromatin modification-related protein n=1 Tax=Penicillium cosmopolitanum TaxID=1131564 RepID=A0A9X0B529_9EURO|nr:Zinc finger PHD-finger [Penicillium cosmopolitanum]KAJ5388342.1 Zinc finger PHD-finger [Penicillium cosmopolitanum]
MSAVSSSTLNPQGPAVRQSSRQTRTNPSRTSKTTGRSSFGLGRPSNAESPATAPIPHGFYPALTHFTDAITALPREFRRHNSLLKEVDAKAWALEENLLQLLKVTARPSPSNPNAHCWGVVREDFLPKDVTQPPETPDSQSRRLLFDRVRQSLSDLMMTADEKNHVISNANEELDRQIIRLDTVFPYIAGEISEEARLGSMTHWAYSNKSTAKAATNERPRREAVSQRQDIAYAIHEAEAASRSEARREAVQARRRRNHVDADYEEPRGAARKTNTGKSRADNAPADQAPKRRKVERPTAIDMGAPMERSASGTGNQRASAKDGTEKKRSRAPNSNAAAARKKPNVTSNAGSPVLAPSPLIGTFNAPRGAASPGPSTARPQSSRAQQNAGQTSNARQRPSSSTSNRLAQGNASKPSDAKSTPRDTSSVKNEVANGDGNRDYNGEAGVRAATAGVRRDEGDGRKAESAEAESAKGRNSKTTTPVSAFAETTQSRSRPTRSTDPAPKRNPKKTAPAPAPIIPSDEESLHEGDDEDEEGEPRYCYCNEISFGEMVACDNDACPREWFHLSCVGMTKPPGKNVKWYCDECKTGMRSTRGR